jgi:Leucine-rich repeat (LRR) protein
LPSLTELHIDGTLVPDLKPLEKATTLHVLTLNNSQIQDLSPIKDLSALTILELNQSKITSLSPLSNLKNLAEISFNQTKISDITPINHIPTLKTVYCKKTTAPQANILEFIRQNPNTLTIFNTDEMETWWSLLSPYWQDYFSGRIGFYGTPTEAHLAAITAINRIDISSRRTVTDISCFNKMWLLTQLDPSMSGITSLVSLAELPYLQKVSINFTEISDVSPLQKLPRLDTLLANNTKIRTLSVLKTAPALRLIECDNAGVFTDDIVVLRTANPNCTVIYNTAKNNQWWADISPTWKKILYGSENAPDKYQLQQILNTTTIDVGENRDIRELSPLRQFNYLKKIIIRGTFVNNLGDISHIKTLSFLDISNTPIVSIDEIASLINIDTLRMENTQLKKYETVGQLKNLKLLDVSGTQIKDLKPLANLIHLEDLSCNNTGVSALKPLENLPNLKKLRIFRTKISERTVRDFKTKQPNCEVVHY